MISAKDLGDTVELTILLPVEEKPLGNTANATGFSAHDTKSTQMVVTLTTKHFIEFVEDVTSAHHRFQSDRAGKIKQKLDAPQSAQ